MRSGMVARQDKFKCNKKNKKLLVQKKSCVIFLSDTTYYIGIKYYD